MFAQWTLAGFEGKLIEAVAVSKSDVIYAIADRSLYKSEDDGDTYTVSVQATTTYYPLGDSHSFFVEKTILIKGEDSVYVAYVSSGIDVVGGLLSNKNFGNQWLPVLGAVGSVHGTLFSRKDFLLTSQWSQVVVSKLDSVYGGQFQYVLNQQLPDFSHTSSYANTPFVKFYESSGNALFAFSKHDTAQFWKSTDDGFSWQRIISLKQKVSGVAELSSTLYCTTVDSGVYRSTDSGGTWVRSGLNTTSLLLLASSANELYAVSDQAIYKSTNGTDWTSFSSGLPSTFQPTALAVAPDGKLYLATDKGLYTSGTLSTDLPGNVSPQTFELSQNYPNPFNPSTTISYSLAQASSVRLAVYDMLGREVASLVNERKPAGNHFANFKAAGLTSGVYFYRLQAASAQGQFSQTKKMLLVK
ncbi:MAG: T9SS type A sorting domain-containing protein [Rhizobacter sp.]|nr:T9SS type A sorting domain-containing protein [Chlorobiales bacterium]